MASSICERLTVFHKVTELFSSTSYPTTNLFFPKVCEIKMLCILGFQAQVMWLGVWHLKCWKILIVTRMRFGVMAVATILDPRYKIELLEYYFLVIYGDEADNEIQRVRDICYEMIRDYSSERMDREGTCGPCVWKDPQVDDSLMDFERYLSKKKKRIENIKLELDH